LTSCAPCRERAAFETSFKTNLRARLHRPKAPVTLRARVMAALDRVDAVGDGPVAPRWRRRLVPVGAPVTAAAAIAVFLVAQHTSSASSPLVAEAITAHEKNLPVEVGGLEDDVGTWMRGKVAVPVRPPRIRNANFMGGRVGHVRNRDAAQLVYRVGRSQVTVYVFDPEGVTMAAQRVRQVGRRQMFVDSQRGFTVIFYRDNGVGYAYASDLGQDEMVRMVSAALTD
jgi:anti-sigma factor RsiW